VEVGKSEKSLDVLQVLRWLPIQHGLHLLRIHFDPFRGDDKTEVFHPLRVELALLDIEEQTRFPKLLQDLSDVFGMLL
ncbi:hypothetical protein K402DRAFT_337456, partial [Aulographum hederae CBS 113979]